MNARDLMNTAPVIPVIVVHDVKTAVPLAESLVAGGLPVLEVTLRTPVAMDAMRAMQSVKGAIVGVGTAINGNDLKAAKDAGAQFAVSPGFTDELGATANDIDLPLLPGIANSADIMRAHAQGFKELKFFPASHLPHRWRLDQQRQRVLIPTQRIMRWRLLGCAKGHD